MEMVGVAGYDRGVLCQRMKKRTRFVILSGTRSVQSQNLSLRSFSWVGYYDNKNHQFSDPTRENFVLFMFCCYFNAG